MDSKQFPQAAGLWKIPVSNGLARRIAPLLSEPERAKAERIRVEAARDRAICARGALRQLLGDWLGVRPETIAFAESPAGKPSVAGGPQFNVSHSGYWVLIAIAHREVGVDIEQIRPMEVDSVARSFFAPAEHTELLQVPDARRLEAFFPLLDAEGSVSQAVGDWAEYVSQKLYCPSKSRIGPLPGRRRSDLGSRP